MAPMDEMISRGVMAYLVMMRPIAPFFHLAYLIFLLRLMFYASWVRSPFEWFITANYAMFLFLPFGWIWMQLKNSEAFAVTGISMEHLPIWSFGAPFGFSGTNLALTALVTYQWYLEAKDPQNLYDFWSTPRWRWWVLPLMAWGFFYPFFPFQGPDRFFFLGWESVWGSPFGLLYAPTTIVLLSLLSLIFPHVNPQLFLVFNVAGLLVFLHTVRASPLDAPLGLIALYNLLLWAAYRYREGRWLLPLERVREDPVLSLPETEEGGRHRTGP